MTPPAIILPNMFESPLDLQFEAVTGPQGITVSFPNGPDLPGTAVLGGTTWSNVVITSVSGGVQSVQLSSPGAGWTLTSLFPNLPGPEVKNGDAKTFGSFLEALCCVDSVLTFSSIPSSSGPTPLLSGWNYGATSSPGGSGGVLGYIGALLADSTVSVYGPMVFPPNGAPVEPRRFDEYPWEMSTSPPGILLRANLISSGSPVTLSQNVTVTHLDLRLYTPPSESWSRLNSSYFPVAVGTGVIDCCGTTLDIVTSGIDLAGGLTVVGTFEAPAPTALDGLSDLIGSGLAAELPPEVQSAFGEFKLRTVWLQFGKSGESPSVLGAGIDLELNGRIPTPALTFGGTSISLVNPTAGLSVTNPFSAQRSFGINLGSTVQIGGIAFDAAVQAASPRYSLYCTPNGQEPFGVGAFIRSFYPTGGTAPAVPAHWGDVSVAIDVLSLSTDIKTNSYWAGARLSASLALFDGGPAVLELTEASFDLRHESSPDSTSLTFSGILEIFGQDVDVYGSMGSDTSITVQLTNHTLGDLIGYFLGFLGSDGATLQSPWNVLNDIPLSDFTLTFDITNHTVSFQYTPSGNTDFGFLQLNGIGIVYRHLEPERKHRVKLYLGGTFLGDSYPMDGDGTSALGWAPLASNGPSVPGKAPFLDLRMLGFGHHLDVDISQSTSHVSQAIAAIESGFTAPSAGQVLPGGLSFDANAGWLIGADFTVLDTVSIAAVFDDPKLFGLAISLSGARAGALAGLDFEVLYKRITAGLGEYSLWLTLPKEMRHLTFGEVNITLPTVGIDIYTNGNFLIDLGYPYNNDYSNSLAVEVFPFVGCGGLYFGELTGADAATLVPQNAPGTFNPVIELGLALQVGLGYQFNAGPLSCSVGLAIEGAIQGAFSNFHPATPNSPTVRYYNLDGMLGLHGWLQGSVNFCIISASVDIDLEATASIIYVSCRPMLLDFSIGVEATASVHVVFFTVHFSFHTTVSKSYTIGSATPAPWDPPPGGSMEVRHIPDLGAVLLSSARRTASRVSAPAPAPAVPNPYAVWNWGVPSGYQVDASARLGVFLQPVVTASAEDGVTVTPRIAVPLFIENPLPADPEAPDATFTSGTPFGVICQAALVWALCAYSGKDWSAIAGELITATDLGVMHAALEGIVNGDVLVAAGFTAEQSGEILHALRVQSCIDESGRVLPEYSLPIFPELSFMTAQDVATVRTVLGYAANPGAPFSNFTSVELEAFLGAALAQSPMTLACVGNTEGESCHATVFPLPAGVTLALEGTTPVGTGPAIDPATYQILLRGAALHGGGTSPSISLEPGDTNLGSAVFRDYFHLIIRSAIEQARAIADDFPYRTATSESLSGVCAAFESDGYTLEAEALAQVNLDDPSILDSVSGWVTIPALGIANRGGLTVNSFLAGMFLIPSMGESPSTTISVSTFVGENASVAGLLVPGQIVSLPNPPPPPVHGKANPVPTSYTVGSGDTLTAIATVLAVPIETLAELIGDLILSPDAPLQLQPFAAFIPKGSTLRSLLHQYGLDLKSFIGSNGSAPILAANCVLTIPGGFTTSNLVTALDAQARQNVEAPGTAPMARSLNRFMASGVRLPIPLAAGVPPPDSRKKWCNLQTAPLFAFTGQLFDGTLSPAQPISVTGTPVWMTNPGSLTSSYHGTIPDGAAALEAKLVPPLTGLPAWKPVRSRFPLGSRMTWQTVHPPDFTSACPLSAPLLWKFPADLVSALAGDADLPLHPAVAIHSSGRMKRGRPPAAYRWAAVIAIPVRPVRAVTSHTGGAGNLYAVLMNDRIREKLTAVSAWIDGQPPSSTSPLDLDLGYETEGTLVSSIRGSDDAPSTSAVTLDCTGTEQAAPLSDPRAFLSVVRNATYIAYGTAGAPDGFPASVFAGKSSADLYLVAVLKECHPEAPVPSWVNAVATTGEIPASGISFRLDAPKLRNYRMVLPEGKLGFSARVDTATGNAGPIDELFHLIGYSVDDGTRPLLGNCPPVSPAAEKEAPGREWTYRRSFTVRPGTAPDRFRPHPPLARSPYRRVKSGAEPYTVTPYPVDIFGNRGLPGTPLSVVPSYRDALVPLGSWPGTGASFGFSGDSAPALDAVIDCSTSRYRLRSGDTLHHLSKRVAGDLATMEKVYYQLARPDVQVFLRCSLGIVQSSFHDELRRYARSLYAFLATIRLLVDDGRLSLLEVTGNADESLSHVAARLGETPESIAAANLDNPNLLAAQSSVDIPVTVSTKFGDTPETILDRAGIQNLGTLGTLNASAALVPGKLLTVVGASYRTRPGDTLASIAEAFGAIGRQVSPAAIVEANSGVGLWPPATRIIAETSVLPVTAGTTLGSILRLESISLEAFLAVNPPDTLDIGGAELFVPARTVVKPGENPRHAAFCMLEAIGRPSTAVHECDAAELLAANRDRADILVASPSIELPGSVNGSSCTVVVTAPEYPTPATLYDGFLGALAERITSMAATDVTVSIGSIETVIVTAKLTLSLPVSPAALVSMLGERFSFTRFSELIGELPILAKGALLLVPPPALRISGTIVPTVPYRSGEISASLVIERSPDLLDPALPDEAVTASVVSVTTPLAPRLSPERDGKDHRGLSLKHFAREFQRVFPGYLVAVKPKSGTRRAAVWAIPLGVASSTTAVDPASVAYFLNPPLGSKLLSGSGVPISVYPPVSGKPPSKEPPTANFSGVDLDEWAKRFLEVFDSVMSPAALATVARVAPDQLAPLLAARKTLVAKIVGSVQPVVFFDDTSGGTRQADAALTFEGILERSLADAYRVDSLVQFSARNVVSSTPIPVTELTLGKIADDLGISVLELLYANFRSPILDTSATIDFGGNEYPITETELGIWLTKPEAGAFATPMKLPAPGASLDALASSAGILTPLPSGYSIGYLQQSESGDLLIEKGTQLNSSGVAPEAFSPGGCRLNLFYLAYALRKIPGAFAGSTLEYDESRTISAPVGAEQTLHDVIRTFFPPSIFGGPRSLPVVIEGLEQDFCVTASGIGIEWVAFNPTGDLTIHELAEKLGVLPEEFVWANYNTPILASGLSITVDDKSIPLTGTCFSAAFGSDSAFVDVQAIPYRGAALEALMKLPGCVAAPPPGISIGYADHENGPFEFKITGGSKLTAAADSLSPGGAPLPAFYLAHRFSKVPGAFAGSKIPTSIGGSAPSAPNITDTTKLHEFYEAHYHGQLNPGTHEPFRFVDMVMYYAGDLVFGKDLEFSWRTFDPLASITLKQIAEKLDVHPVVLAWANLSTPMFKTGAAAPLPGRPGYTLAASSFAALCAGDDSYFSHHFGVPTDNEALDALCEVPGILAPLGTGSSIGIAKYSAGGGRAAVTSIPQNYTIQNLPTNPAIPGGAPLPGYYVAYVLKDVEGAFAGQTLKGRENTKFSRTIRPDETLEHVYHHTFTVPENPSLPRCTYPGTDIPLDLADLILYSTPALRTAMDIKLTWIPLTTSIPAAITAGLRLSGKPVNSTISIPERDASLAGIARRLTRQHAAPIDGIYVGKVLRSVRGILRSGVISGMDVPPGSTLATLYAASGIATLEEFLASIAEVEMFVPRAPLPISWSRYGAPITAASAASLLGHDVPTFVWSNFENAIWKETPESKLCTFSTAPGFSVDSKYPAPSLPGSIYAAGHLIPSSSVGILTFGQAGGNFPVAYVPSQTFNDFVSSLIDPINGTARFSAEYVGTHLRRQTGLFSGTVANVNGTTKSRTIEPTDSLESLAAFFEYTGAYAVAEFVADAATSLSMTSGALTFNWVPLAEVMTSPSVQDVAEYFAADVEDVIEANWLTPGLLNENVVLHYGTVTTATTSNDTLATLAARLVGADSSPGTPAFENFCSAETVVGNRKLLAPYGRPGLLKVQPQSSFTGSALDVGDDTSYLTFALKQAGSPEERIALDLTYHPRRVEVAGEGTAPPVELELVLPAPLSVGSVEVPVPLRSYPGTPLLTGQSATPTSVGSTMRGGEAEPLITPPEAICWNYSFGYQYLGAPEDSIELTVELGPLSALKTGTETQVDEAPDNLFSHLARFISIMPALLADLNTLAPLAGGSSNPATVKRISSAVETFVTHAGNIGNAWTPMTSTPEPDPDLLTCRFAVEELYDPTDGQLVITVSTRGSTMLPGSYTVPFIVPDPAVWTPAADSVNLVPHAATIATYTYQLSPNATDTGKRSVRFLNALSVLAYPAARGSVEVIRNRAILFGASTTDSFVTRSPQVTFHHGVTPVLDRKNPVYFFPRYRIAPTMQGRYTRFLAELFRDLFGEGWAKGDWGVQAILSFRTELAVRGVDPLVTDIPLGLSRRGPLDARYVRKLGRALAKLREAHRLENGSFIFDLTIYGDESSSASHPIVRLRKLVIPLEAVPVQSRRFVPAADPDQVAWATDPDAVNPLVTHASTMSDVTVNSITRRMLSYGPPVKLKSWFGPMVWADNETPYYNNGTEYASRQAPIYADPIIALYVRSLPDAGPDSYNGYFTQSTPPPATDHDRSVYGAATWHAGFHLSMPNPTMSNGAAINSGTSFETYNNDALIFNAGLDSYVPGSASPPAPPKDTALPWTAAKSSVPLSADAVPDFTDFEPSKPPPASFQSSLCQYAVWRDTLSVAPATYTPAGISDGHQRYTATPAFAARCAKLDAQGDFHAVFRMEPDTVGEGSPNQALVMTVVQGSPLTQFAAAGLDGVRVSGIFFPEAEQTALTAGGVYPAEPGSVSGVHAIDGAATSLSYLIIYQQVNQMHAERIPSLGNPRTNWVSFAVYWNPLAAEAWYDGLDVHVRFLSRAVDNYVVVAGLPSQVANPGPSGVMPYQPKAAAAWAEKIALTAFNFVTTTEVSYTVGKDRRGAPAEPNQVFTTFSYGFEQRGPVSAPDTTTVLLQPHQYLDPFDRSGSVLVPGDLEPLFAGNPAPGAGQYWISRGRLKEMTGATFSIVYRYPNLMPWLPLFPVDAVEAPAPLVNPSNQPQGGATVPSSYRLIEMAAALIGDHWVGEYPSADGTPQNAPATTSMANTGNMQDTYNVGKNFFRAAKLLPMLCSMVEQNHFTTQDVVDRINGATIYAGGQSLYGVGAVEAGTETVYFTPGLALRDFTANLVEAFDYYFGGRPLEHVSRSIDEVSGARTAGKSFYYSYYDKSNHHLFLYPASGAGGIWPTSRNIAGDYPGENPLVFDGYGTVSMLNDHAYTYGYLISAASLLAMVIQKDLKAMRYTSIDGSNGTVSASTSVASAVEQQRWNGWLESIRPVIDSLIMDIAYSPAADTGDASGFCKLPGLEFPRMEFLDQWTGISWTDGFMESGSVAGHNANSPWEEMLAWVGVIQWGYATQRQPLVDLGMYLYTTALYSLEYYNYNVTQSYQPSPEAPNTSLTGDFLPRAANDFLGEFVFQASGTTFDRDKYNPLTFAEQHFQGRTMSETMMSDSKAGIIQPSLTPEADHRTAHVTYLYQGSVRSDNTYWNSPVGMLSTAIYPHGPFSLALARHPGYMRRWIDAIKFQNGLSYYQLSYPTTINLLNAMLGGTSSVVGEDFSGFYARSSNFSGLTTPIPCDGNLYDYAPAADQGQHRGNPQENAFLYLSVNENLSPYQWFWQKASGINQQASPSDCGTPPWQSETTGETLSMYVPADKSEAEVLLYFYTYSSYGTPNFDWKVGATWAIGGGSETPPMLPMGMAWRKVDVRVSNETVIEFPVLTFTVHNPNAGPVTVQFRRGRAHLSASVTVPPGALVSWCEWE